MTSSRFIYLCSSLLLLAAPVGCGASGDDADSSGNAFTGGSGNASGGAKANPSTAGGAAGAAASTTAASCSLAGTTSEALEAYAGCRAKQNDAFVAKLEQTAKTQSIFADDDMQNLEDGIKAYRSATESVCQVASDAAPDDGAIALAACNAMRELDLAKLFAAYPIKGGDAATPIAKDTDDLPDCYPDTFDAHTLASDNAYQFCASEHLITSHRTISPAIGEKSPDKAAGADAEVSAAVDAEGKSLVGLCAALAVANNGGHGEQTGTNAATIVRCFGDANLLTLRELLGKDQPN